MKAPPYLPLYQRDFVHSCRTSCMSAEEVGALVMAICQQWENMGPIAFDPAKFAAYTGWDIRIARRLLARLLEIGKLHCDNDGLQSSRMTEEITKYIARVRAAEAREARKAGGELQQTSTKLLPKFPQKSGTSSPKFFEKPNIFNETPTREGSLPDIRYQIPEKIDPPVSAVARGVANGERALNRQSRTSLRYDQARACIESYNHDARKHGWTVCQTITDARLSRMLKRLDDIGGPEPFAAALRQIPTEPFLMGQIEPKSGSKRFKLDIDRLLSTGSGLGDLLAKLIDQAGEAPELVGPNGERWGFWRQDIDKLKTLSAGYWRQRLDEVLRAGKPWPWWYLGPPPGHAECYVHPDVIAERGLIEKYQLGASA